jgi:hypothetical protein
VKLLARILFPAFLLATILTILLQVEPFSGGHATLDSLILQVDWQPTEGGISRLYYDTGDGFVPGRYVVARVNAKTRQRSRFKLPPGRLDGFRLLLPEHRGSAVVFGLRITDLAENEVLSLDPNEFWQDEETDGVEFKDDGVNLTNGATLTTEAPLDVHSTSEIDKVQTAICFVCALLLSVLLLWKLETSGSAVRARFFASAERAIAGARKSPLLTLLVTSAVAVLVSCHPIIFFGKSLVSPNNRAICLYDDYPTVPGSPAGPIEDPKASDVGAMLWSHLPYSVMENRAIFHDGELPLWDRWNSCGVPLLGQGQSMIGDPLHWIPILANGAPWAWDAKFVLARFALAFGVGMLVLAAVDRLGLAVLLSASSVFLGFFSYRFNHAACFSLCYAPWILFAWFKIAAAPDWRRAGRWALLLAAANWMELNSGAAKEASMLILGMNFSGGLVALLSGENWAWRVRRLTAGAGGLVVFLLISAPCWLVFLDALRHAFTAYDRPRAYQIQPSLFLGLFDDIFYRETTFAEMHTNPAANFFLLLGVLWALASVRRLASKPLFLGIALSALPPLAMAFGLVPPGLILRLPFIGNISHIDNTFSCVLIILFFPIAAFGFRECRDRMESGEWRGDWLVTLLLGGALALAYFGYTQAQTRSGSALMHEHNPMAKTPFFIGYVTALFLSIALLPVAVRAVFLRRPGMMAGALIAGLALCIMHFRMGMYLETKFDAYVMNPEERVDLAARSPAVEFVKAHLPEPARVTGFDGVLTPGFNAVLGLESPGGSDPLENRFYHEMTAAMRFEILWDWRMVVGKENVVLLRPLYDFLNIRYYLGQPTTPPANLPGLRLDGSRDLEVFESPFVWPRAFFTDTLVRYRAISELPPMIWDGDLRPFAAMQMGEEKDLPALPGNLATRRVARASDYRVTTNTITFTVDAPAPGIAVVSEGFEEGNFRATANGKPVDYFRVNHAFKGVYLPKPGRYVIRFSYWPRMLTPALWLSALGMVMLGCAGAVLFARGKTLTPGRLAA